jgi:hypothetical protein
MLRLQYSLLMVLVRSQTGSFLASNFQGRLSQAPISANYFQKVRNIVSNKTIVYKMLQYKKLESFDVSQS